VAALDCLRFLGLKQSGPNRVTILREEGCGHICANAP
jgi:hypothetical protein